MDPATRCVAGLDFGTSNSAVGYARGPTLALHRFEHGGLSTPTALFHDDEDGALVCGHEAETRFLEGHEGRYLRALKSILGTALAEESTRLGRRPWPFQALIVRFLKHLKTSVEAAVGDDIRHLVAGRPVRFVDDDGAQDARAEATLRAALEAAGFAEIRFVPEPVAALIDAGDAIPVGSVVLVADIGGGTSDFTLARRSDPGPGADGDGFEILANHGLHIGGTDLDRKLSLDAVMPALGHGSRMRALTSDAVLPVPAGYFLDLATWQKIHFCYTRAIRREVGDVQRLALEPEKIGRLLTVLDRQLGHQLATEVERAKIRLSDRDETVLAVPELDDLPEIAVTRPSLARSFAAPLARVGETARETIALGGLAPARIDHLVLTGGSTLLPDMRRILTDVAPAARIVSCDPFTAVAAGLTKAARRTFR
jgi:hypothetical chaperone protein